MVENSINWLLQQDTSINEVLQNRVAPHVRDDDEEFPAITFECTSPYQEKLMDGSLSSIGESEVSLNVWGERYIQAKELSNQIKSYLQNFKGDANGVFISLIKFDNDSESTESDPDRYLITLNFTFYTNEG